MCVTPVTTRSGMNVLLSTTSTVTQAVDTPLRPEAVSVYLVVLCGATSIEPEAGKPPGPLSMVTDAAPDTLQRSVTFSPGLITSAAAEKSSITGQYLSCTTGAGAVRFSASGLCSGGPAGEHPARITAADKMEMI